MKLGVNANLTWTHLPNRYGNPPLPAIIAQEGFESVRWPGGSISHFLDAATGNYGGDVGTSWNTRALKSINEGNRAAIECGVYKAQDFVEFIQAWPHEWVYVAPANMSSNAHIETLRILKDAGVEMERAEIVNEAYENGLKVIFSPVERYITKAEQIRDEIRSVYPDVILGIPYSSNPYRPTMVPDSWDEGVGTIGWPHAVIVHIYTTFDPNQTDEQIYQQIRQYWVENWPNVVAKHADREIWITEWSIALWGHMRERAFEFMKTRYFELFCWEMMMDILLTPQVTQAHHHSLRTILISGSRANRVFPILGMLMRESTELKQIVGSDEGVRRYKFGNYDVILNTTPDIMDIYQSPYSAKVVHGEVEV